MTIFLFFTVKGTGALSNRRPRVRTRRAAKLSYAESPDTLLFSSQQKYRQLKLSIAVTGTESGASASC